MSWINDAVAWIKTTKDGEKYISLKVERDIKEGESIALFKNNKNGVETRPDYRASHKEEEQEQPNRDMGQVVSEEIPF